MTDRRGLPGTALPRRALLLGLSATPLAGCGFQPVYMPTASGRPGPAARELAAINVPPIAERQGQLLRQALQERFGDDAGATPLLYDLTVAFAIAAEPIAIRPDNLPTRIRLIGRATYTLDSRPPAPARITSGSARVQDNYNLIDQQYFAAELESEAVLRRIAQTLAEQIALQLAMYFRKRANG
jgi:LPS-assembly lipoprotein